MADERRCGTCRFYDLVSFTEFRAGYASHKTARACCYYAIDPRIEPRWMMEHQGCADYVREERPIDPIDGEK